MVFTGKGSGRGTLTGDGFRTESSNQSLAPGAVKRVRLALLLCAFGAGVLVAPPALADDVAVTFGEPIPVPETVRTQYCNNPVTNKGLESKFDTRIYVPVDEASNPVQTSSPTHALTNELPGEEFAAHKTMILSFTVGQTHVGARVGLDRNWGFPVTARLRAFDDPDPGEGAKLTPDPDPSVSLGTGPAPVTTPLEWSTPDDDATIRRVEFEFLNPLTNEVAVEVIDDLSYSVVGPPCVTDIFPPSVQILQPSPNQAFSGPEFLLRYLAQDDVGVATVKVVILDANGDELGSFFPSFTPSTLVQSQFYTYALPGTAAVRLQVTDFAGKKSDDEVPIGLALPGPDLNLWALAIEVTQGLQNHVPESQQSRRNFATEANLISAIPLIAGKRTIVRVYPGVEGTTNPVVGARVSLHCRKSLGANLGAGETCDGPLSANLVNPAIVIDPANGNDVDTLRRDSALTWNFVLPVDWTRPGTPRWLIAVVHAPPYVPECGRGTADDCDDGANFFVLRLPGFHETAPLLVQPIITCIRRDPNVPPETCTSVAATVSEAQDLVENIFWTADWDNDGIEDRFFGTVLPVADLSEGVKINPPIMNEFADGDLNTPNGIVSDEKMGDLLAQICEQSDLDNLNTLFGDAPGRAIYVALVPPPTGPSGKANLNKPCAVVKFDTINNRVNDNDYCRNCPGEPVLPLHYDVPTTNQEIVHTFDITHASCDHNEGTGGGCDPAPVVFPCPHGGICPSVANQDEPFAFEPFYMRALPPRKGTKHAHDFMSYGPEPVWFSPRTYQRMFTALRAELALAIAALETAAGSAPTAVAAREGGGALEAIREIPRDPALVDAGREPSNTVLFVSGRIQESTGEADLGPLRRLPLGPNTAGLRETYVGAYTLELLDAQGTVLAQQRFDPAKSSVEARDEKAYFSVLLPYREAAVRLVLKRAKRVLAERARSPRPPVVRLVTPSGGETWRRGPQRIRWEAVDGDGDAVLSTIQYSRDRGRTWKTLAMERRGPTLDVDVDLLPGSDRGGALLRVLASDGFNSIVVQSQPFTVIGKPPRVRIFSPKNGATVRERDFIALVGAAVDPEDGTLGDGAYTWRSDRDGVLGQGHEVRPRLTPGGHWIFLTARDSSGNTATAQLRLIVEDEPPRQPVADAGDNQTVYALTEVTLDGSESFDPDGKHLTFSWRMVSAPMTFELGTASSPTPTFLARQPGTYVFELSVDNGEVPSFPARVAVYAQKAP